MVKKKRVLGSNSLNVKKYFDNATPKQKFAALGGGATLLTGVGLYQANATEKEQSNKNSDASKASSKVTDEYDLNGKPKKKNDLERLINGNTKDKDKTLSRLTGDNSSESTLSDLLGSNDKDMDTSKDADNVLAKLKDEETSKGNTNGSETRLSGQSTGMPSVNMDSGKTRGNNVTIKPIVNKENSRPKVKTGGSNENKTVTPLVKPDNNVNQNKGDNTVPSVPNGGNQGGGTTTPPTIPDNGGNQGGGTTTPPTTPDKGGNQGGGTTTPPTIPDNGGNQGGGTTTPPTTPDNGGNQGGGTTTPPTTPDNGGNQGGGTTTPPTTPDNGGNQGGGTTTPPTTPDNGGNQGGGTTTPPTTPDNGGNQGGGTTTPPTTPDNGGNQGGGTTTPPTTPDNGGNQGGGTTTPPTTPDNGGNQGGGTTTPPTTPDNGGNQGGGTTTPPTTPDNGGNQGGGTTTPPTNPDNGGNQGGGTTTPPPTPDNGANQGGTTQVPEGLYTESDSAGIIKSITVNELKPESLSSGKQVVQFEYNGTPDSKNFGKELQLPTDFKISGAKNIKLIAPDKFRSPDSAGGVPGKYYGVGELVYYVGDNTEDRFNQEYRIQVVILYNSKK